MNDVAAMSILDRVQMRAHVSAATGLARAATGLARAATDSEVSTFNHASRRWVGQAPRDYCSSRSVCPRPRP